MPPKKEQQRLLSGDGVALNASSDQKNLRNETKRCQDLQQKLQLAEMQIETQRKEIAVLHHELGAARRTTGASASPTQVVPHTADESSAEAMESLRKENAALKKVVRKQMQLIDILKRQKILSEASTVLTLTEREFAKDLELDQA